MADPEPLYAQCGRRDNNILIFIGNIVAWRAKAVIFPLYFVIVRVHLKCCTPFSLYKKKVELLEHVQRRTVKLVKGL